MHPQDKIRAIIDKHGGEWRRLPAEGVREIAELTWFCKATYGDVRAIGNGMLSDMVERQETRVHREWAKEQYQLHGRVDYSWRLGVEMAKETPRTEHNELNPVA